MNRFLSVTALLAQFLSFSCLTANATPTVSNSATLVASATVLPIDGKSEAQLRRYTEANATAKVQETSWLAKHAALVRKAVASSSQLEFFGDSITAYISDNGVDAIDRDFSQYKPENYGIPGDVTEELMWRMTHGELAGRPKVIVLMIGSNDMIAAKAKTAAAIAQNIADIVSLIRAYLPTTKVLVMGILPRSATTDQAHARLMALRHEINTDISHLDDGRMVRYFDIGDQFIDAEENVRADLLPDYVHPNQTGYAVWFDAIKPVIDSMMR